MSASKSAENNQRDHCRVSREAHGERRTQWTCLSGKVICRKVLPSSHTLSQTRIITSGSHVSARGSHEETLSRPDFYRGRNKNKDTLKNEQAEERQEACENV